MKRKLILAFVFCFFSLSNCSEDKCSCIINDKSVVEYKTELEETFDWPFWELLNKSHLRESVGNTYRLITIPPFSLTGTEIYTLEEIEGEYYVSKQFLNKRENGFLVDSLNRVEVVLISEEEWENFQNTLEINCFWTIEPLIESKYNSEGAGMILEAKENKINLCTGSNYHLVGRTPQNNNSRFSNVCQKIIGLYDEKRER